jgi:hypothetical protein
MTLKQKSLNFSYPGSILINLCLYIFISSVVYYLLSLNTNLLKLAILCSAFILIFYLSSKNSAVLLQKMKLKNIIIFSKFFLGLISLTAAVLIYNNFSLSSNFLYLLILTTSILYAVLNRAHNIYYQKIIFKDKANKKKELIFQFNLEKLLIVILAAAAAVFIKANLIPLILLGTAVYYFISAYLNTFQQF